MLNIIEEIFNWTYPGATLYYKDCELNVSVIEQFTKARILRNGYFLDVTCKGAGIKFNTRFLIASAKAANLYEINPDNEKYGHCCINANSYFKILDVYELKGKTQIFLLHIPAQGISYFRKANSNMDDFFIQKARLSFDEKCEMEPLPELLETGWVKRTNFPVGMDAQNKFYPLDELTPLPAGGQEVFNEIRVLVNDLSEINMPIPIIESIQRVGFWKRLFGK